MDEKDSLDAALKAINNYNASIGVSKSKKSDKKGEKGEEKDDKKPKKVSPLAVSTFEEWMSSTSSCLDVISTGISELDEASGIGGFPKGKMVELFGTESGGKSYTAYKTIASCQKAGGVAALLDPENSFTPEWARVIGIDLKSLIYKNESLSGEQYLEVARELCSGGLVDLVVIDSTAALIPQSELDGVIGDAAMAAVARFMSPGVRMIMSAAKSRGKGGKQTCVIWINQIREKPGVSFGNPERTPGGRALKFYSHMRVDVRKVKVLYKTQGEDQIPIAQISKGTFVKNKVAPPYKKFEFTISFESSYENPLVKLVELAKENKLFYKRGGSYKYRLEDEKIDPVETEAPDFISLARWIFDQGKVDEIVGRVTDIMVGEEKEIPAFFEEIDENTKPPVPVKDGFAEGVPEKESGEGAEEVSIPGEEDNQ